MSNFSDLEDSHPQNVVPLAVGQSHRHGVRVVQPPRRSTWRLPPVFPQVPDQNRWLKPIPSFVQGLDGETVSTPAAQQDPSLLVSANLHPVHRVGEDLVLSGHNVGRSIDGLIEGDGSLRTAPPAWITFVQVSPPSTERPRSPRVTRRIPDERVGPAPVSWVRSDGAVPQDATIIVQRRSATARFIGSIHSWVMRISSESFRIEG